MRPRRFTDEQVRDIRARWIAGEPSDDIAERFGLDRPTASLIARGLKYPRVDGPVGQSRYQTRSMLDERYADYRLRHA